MPLFQTLHDLGKAGITGEEHADALPPVLKRITQVLATGFGTGYLPRAHGTAASALFVLLWVGFVPRSKRAEWTAVVLTHALSVPLSAFGERLWGHDPGRVTIDEFAGQAVALTALPNRRWYWLLAAFLLFRLFDVWKLPFTRNRIEPIRHGIGTTFDDTLAGGMAWALLRVARLFLPRS